MYNRVEFKLVYLNDLMDIDRKLEMESLIFILEKRDKSLKVIIC